MASWGLGVEAVDPVNPFEGAGEAVPSGCWSAWQAWAYRVAAWSLLHLGEDAASLAFLFC